MCTSTVRPFGIALALALIGRRRRRFDAHPAGGRFRRLVVAGPGRDRGVGVPRLVGHRTGLPGPEPGPRLPDVVRGGRDPGRSAARRGAGVGVGALALGVGPGGRAAERRRGPTVRAREPRRRRPRRDRRVVRERPAGARAGLHDRGASGGRGFADRGRADADRDAQPAPQRGRPRDRLRRAERRPCAALRGTGRDGRAREGVAGVVRGVRRGPPARDPDRRRRRGRRVPGDDRPAGDEPRVGDLRGSRGELRLRASPPPGTSTATGTAT